MGSVSRSTWIFAVLLGALITVGVFLVERGRINQEVEQTLSYQASVIFPSPLGYGYTSQSVIGDINASINSGNLLTISSANVSLSRTEDELSHEAIPPAIPHTVTSYSLSLGIGLLLIASIAVSLGLLLLLEKLAKAFWLGEAHYSKQVPQFIQQELRLALKNAGIEYDSEPSKIKQAIQKLTEQQHRDLTNAIDRAPENAKKILDLLQAKPGVTLKLNKKKSELHVHGLVTSMKPATVGFAIYAWMLSRKTSFIANTPDAHLVPPCSGETSANDLAEQLRCFLEESKLPIHKSLDTRLASSEGIDRAYVADQASNLKKALTSELHGLDWIADHYLIKQSKYKELSSHKGYEVMIDKADIEIVNEQPNEHVQS
jgi:hypothetical protein